MGDVLERLRAEWAVIRQAPFSFAAMAVVVAAGAWGLADLAFSTRLENERSTNALLKEQIEQGHKEATPNRPSGPPVAKGAKIEGIPIQRLQRFYEGRTDAEAKRLVAPYAGAKVRVTGRVRNVVADAKWPTFVHLQPAERGPVVTLVFMGPASASLGMITLNDQIDATCEFDGDMDADGVTFTDCVLFGPEKVSPSD